MGVSETPSHHDRPTLTVDACVPQTQPDPPRARGVRGALALWEGDDVGGRRQGPVLRVLAREGQARSVPSTVVPYVEVGL